MKAVRLIAFLGLSAFFGLLPSAAPAGEGEAGAGDWTVITCEGNLFMDYAGQKATFFNNVRVANPRGDIRSDRLTIFFSSDGKTVERAEGEGNVRIESEGRIGRAEKLIYYPGEKKSVLIGEAEVSLAGDTVRGGMITFFLDTREMEVLDRPVLEYVPDDDIRVDF